MRETRLEVILNVVKHIVLSPFYLALFFIWCIVIPFMMIGFSYALIKYFIGLL
jgi:hypothetical protein